jgi:hypothetical protein
MVGELNLNFLRAVDDVMICQNGAVRRYDNSRTQAQLHSWAALCSPWKNTAKKITKTGIVKKRVLLRRPHTLGCPDRDNRGPGTLDHIGVRSWRGCRRRFFSGGGFLVLDRRRRDLGRGRFSFLFFASG